MYKPNPLADARDSRRIRYLLLVLLTLPLLCCACTVARPESHNLRAENAHPHIIQTTNHLK